MPLSCVCRIIDGEFLQYSIALTFATYCLHIRASLKLFLFEFGSGLGI